MRDAGWLYVVGGESILHFSKNSGLSQILPSDWLSYSLSIRDRKESTFKFKTMTKKLRLTFQSDSLK